MACLLKQTLINFYDYDFVLWDSGFSLHTPFSIELNLEFCTMTKLISLWIFLEWQFFSSIRSLQKQPNCGWTFLCFWLAERTLRAPCDSISAFQLVFWFRLNSFDLCQLLEVCYRWWILQPQASLTPFLLLQMLVDLAPFSLNFSSSLWLEATKFPVDNVRRVFWLEALLVIHFWLLKINSKIIPIQWYITRQSTTYPLQHAKHKISYQHCSSSQSENNWQYLCFSLWHPNLRSTNFLRHQNSISFVFFLLGFCQLAR